MKFLLAFCLIVFLEAVHGYYVPDAFTKIQEIKSSVKSFIQNAKQSPKTIAQCESEVMPVMLALVSDSCTYRNFALNISNSSSPNPVNYTDAVAARDAMCTACDIPAQRTILDGTTYCTGREDMFLMVRSLLDMLAIDCHKTGSTYCFDSLFGGDDESSGSSAPPNQTELTTLCTDPCFDTIATFIQNQVPCLAHFQFLTVVCEQDSNGTYCAEAVITMQDAYLNFSSNDLLTETEEAAFHDDLEPFCETCGNNLYTSWFTTKANQIAQCPNGTLGDNEAENNFYGMLCDVDATGDLCMPHIREFNFSGGGRNFTDCPNNSGGFSNYTANSDCGSVAGCQATHISISTTFGCCYNSIIELYNGYSEVAAGQAWAEGTCGAPVNPICQSLVEFQGESGAGYKIQPAALLSVLSAASVLMLMW